MFGLRTMLLQVRGEWKTNDKDKGNNVVNSGYYLLTLLPQLSYSIAGKWNVTFVFDIPMCKNYNGKQMTRSTLWPSASPATLTWRRSHQR